MTLFFAVLAFTNGVSAVYWWWQHRQLERRIESRRETRLVT